MNYTKFWRVASAALMIVIAIFLLAPGAWAQSKYKTLHKFTKNVYPGGVLTFDEAGNLYGTTGGGGDMSCSPKFGCGTVFKLVTGSDGRWTKTVLHAFHGGSDGRSPYYAGVIFDAAGNLYGTTGYSSTGCQCGTVFRLTPNSDGSWSESVLHVFEAWDGANPTSELTFDTAGNLYGTATKGGTANLGVVFKLTPNPDGSWTESVLYSFQGGPKEDGGTPEGKLIFDRAGNLYGTTSTGGHHYIRHGTVFKLAPNSDGTWTKSTLYFFNGKRDGWAPSGLISDVSGNLYGATFFGGGSINCYNGGCGTVFKLAPNADGSWTESVLHRFHGKDGEGPSGPLILDAGGDFYGSTRSGGRTGYGLVFKLAPTSTGWVETVLHEFNNKQAAAPDDGLIFDTAGNLYGATAGDGTKTFGSVFEITP